MRAVCQLLMFHSPFLWRKWHAITPKIQSPRYDSDYDLGQRGIVKVGLLPTTRLQRPLLC